MRRPRSERGRICFFLVVLDAFGHPHHIAHRNAAAFPRQPIAAARAAHAFEDAGAHQLLHHLFQIALRHALAGGDFLGLHRLGPGIEGDVDHRFQRQQGLAGQVAASWSVSRHAGRAEAARAARAVAASFGALDQFGLFMAGDHHLRDLGAARDRERLRRRD